MDEQKKQQIARIKKLIAEGELEKALEQLLTFLERESAYLNMHSDALQALSQYRQTKREETKGTISYEEARRSYSKVTDLTLNLLEGLQKEDKIKPYQRRWPILAGLAALVLLAAGGAYWYFSRGDSQAAVPDWECPGFGGQEFNILLMPFQGPDTIDLQTPRSLREYFITFENEHRIPLDYRILTFGPQVINDVNRFPPDFDFATRIGADCSAQLVLWGLSDGPGPGTRLVKTRYQFILPEDGGFQLRKVTLEDTGGTVFDTVRFASNFAVGGEIEEQLGTVIQLMLGIIAHQQNQPQAAIAQLANLESGDSLATLARDMMLADSYLSTGQSAMADSTYNRVLEQHPEYWLGWYNRGMLSLQRGDYDQAIYDLNNRLALNDKDTSALTGLGQAYLARGQLIEAERSFERARQLAPGSSTLDRRLELVRDSIQLQQNLLRDAEERLQRNPDDTEALRQKAKSSYQLGDPAAAIAAGERLQQLAPSDRAALTTLARSYQETNQLEKAQEVIRRAATQGLIQPDSAQKLNRQLRVRNLQLPRN